MPFYRGERITFDVAPSRLDFTVEHDSLRIEVKLWSRAFGFPALGTDVASTSTSTPCLEWLLEEVGLWLSLGYTGSTTSLTQHLHLAELAKPRPVLLLE